MNKTWKVYFNGEIIDTGATDDNNTVFTCNKFPKNTGTTDLSYLIEVTDDEGYVGTMEYMLKPCPQNAIRRKNIK